MKCITFNNRTNIGHDKNINMYFRKKNMYEMYFFQDFSRFDLKMTLTLTFEWPHLYIILKCYISIVVIWLINISFNFVEKVIIRLVIFTGIPIYGGHLGRHLGFLSCASVAKWLYSIFINTEPYPTTWYQNKKYSRGVPKFWGLVVLAPLLYYVPLMVFQSMHQS